MKCFYCKKRDASSLIISGIANPIEESTYSPVCEYCDIEILIRLHKHFKDKQEYFFKPLPDSQAD